MDLRYRGPFAKEEAVKSSMLSTAACAMLVPVTAIQAAPPTAASVQQFAKCAAENYEGAELLATQPGSAEEQEVIAEYGRRSCLTPPVAVGVLRGAVAEQLFKADFGTIGSQPRRDVIEVFTVDTRELAELDDAARKRIDYVAFGTCVAASDPDRSSKLLGVPAESSDEKKILSEMVPHFASCLAEGERFMFSRADLRSALAEGAYRLALSQSLDEEVVVTGTRDPSKRVQCKLQEVAGTRIRRNICLTATQWAERDRVAEYAAEDNQRRAREYQEIQTTILARSRFAAGCIDAGMC
jgi:hypothetical protein